MPKHTIEKIKEIVREKSNKNEINIKIEMIKKYKHYREIALVSGINEFRIQRIYTKGSNLTIDEFFIFSKLLERNPVEMYYSNNDNEIKRYLGTKLDSIGISKQTIEDFIDLLEVASARGLDMNELLLSTGKNIFKHMKVIDRFSETKN